MLTATSTFVDALDKWVGAMKSLDFTGAQIQAERLHKYGEILAIRPEFRHCFDKHSPNLDTEEALRIVGMFLLCTTECRQRAHQS